MPLLFWFESGLTAADERNKQKRMQDILVRSHAQICREIELRIEDLQSMEPGPELDVQLSKVRKELERWQKTWIRLAGCQTQWIGYKADCCGTSVAVPIGCNHRLCFLCNSTRLQKYRERVKTLFGRLTHPIFLTLTVPNVAKLSKRTFSRYRRGWNEFRKSQAWIEGGIYAIETTHSESLKAAWHLHSHALIDSATALPSCRCGRCDRCGKWRKSGVCRCGGRTSWRWHRYDDTGGWGKDHSAQCEFVRFKRRVEFDWFLVTGGRAAGWSSAAFHSWFNKTEHCGWRSESARHEWNLRNRRTVHVERVDNREKACFEIVKYVTKTAEFAGNPGAVREFSDAARGARMLQTFGSWYGLKLTDDVNAGAPSEKNSWGHLQCECGLRDFHRFGVVYGDAVYMAPSGQWMLRAEVHCRGVT